MTIIKVIIILRRLYFHVVIAVFLQYNSNMQLQANDNQLHNKSECLHVAVDKCTILLGM